MIGDLNLKRTIKAVQGPGLSCMSSTPSTDVVRGSFECPELGGEHEFRTIFGGEIFGEEI
jgi:hypothetical protein